MKLNGTRLETWIRTIYEDKYPGQPDESFELSFDSQLTPSQPYVTLLHGPLDNLGKGIISCFSLTICLRIIHGGLMKFDNVPLAQSFKCDQDEDRSVVCDDCLQYSKPSDDVSHDKLDQGCIYD